MKKCYNSLLLAIVINLVISVVHSFGQTQTMIVATDAPSPTVNLALSSGVDLGPGNGIALIGVFINPDNVTQTSLSDIAANWYDFNWMASRFRAFGDSDPGDTFTFDVGGTVDTFFDAANLNSRSIGGAASSISLASRFPVFAWVFSGASVPTSQSAYNLLETGVFYSPLQAFGDGSPFGNFHSFLFATDAAFGSADPNLDALPGFRVGAELRLQPVPEPSTVALVLLGAAGVLIARRRRK